MTMALPRLGWIAFVCSTLAVLGSVLVHPIALLCLAGPYGVYLLDRSQLPDLPERIWAIGSAAALGLILLLFSDIAHVSLYLAVGGMAVSVLAFANRSSTALAVISGATVALAAASLWFSYPTPLLIGLCLGVALLCVQIHWLETVRNAQLDLEDQIVLRTQRIRYLLRERDEVTTLAVHDLQSPIQAVAGMQKTLLHMLENDTPDKASMRQALEVAIETNADLSDRIGSLLNASRDHLGGSTDTTSLSRIIDGTIAAHKIELQGREILVRADTASQVHLRNDEDIKDILDVLLDNAIKYAPENGKIDISARYDAPGQVVVIDIQDNGPGVPENKRDILFSAPRSKRSENGRTGLGLYLASRRATRLGGSLTHIAPRKGGALFRVILPTACLDT